MFTEKVFLRATTGGQAFHLGDIRPCCRIPPNTLMLYPWPEYVAIHDHVYNFGLGVTLILWDVVILPQHEGAESSQDRKGVGVKHQRVVNESLDDIKNMVPEFHASSSLPDFWFECFIDEMSKCDGYFLSIPSSCRCFHMDLPQSRGLAHFGIASLGALVTGVDSKSRSLLK